MGQDKSITLIYEKSLFEIKLNGKTCLVEFIIYNNEENNIKDTVKFNFISGDVGLTEKEKDEIYGIISMVKLNDEI